MRANLDGIADGDAIREVTRVEITLQSPDRQDQFCVLNFLLDIRMRDAPNINLLDTKLH
jgi:hypothetical protein